MPVVKKWGSGARDPASLLAIQAVNAAAVPRIIKSLVNIANGDSATSQYVLGEMPADAIINPGAITYYDAITGVSSASLGIAYGGGGAMILATALFNGQSLAGGGSVNMVAATGSGMATPANMAKPLWQLAGLAANPGGNLALVLTINTAATASGNVFAEYTYGKGA